MKTESVPIRMTPSIVIWPPFQRTRASAFDPISVTSEMNIALKCPAPTDTRRISSESCSKSSCIRFSTTSVLMLRAPVIPSLKFPVMLEFSSRIFRFRTISFFWKSQIRKKSIGTRISSQRNSRRLMTSIRIIIKIR